MAVSKAPIQPNYSKLHEWEVYGRQLPVEFEQSMEEGLDVERYQDLFEAVSKMPDGVQKEKMADVLFELVQNAGQREDYPYTEPSELVEIRQLRKPYAFARKKADNL